MNTIREERFYHLALAAVPQVGPVQAKILLQHLDAKEIFQTRGSTLEKIEGIGQARARAITRFRDFKVIENELEFISRNNITPLFITDDAYPKRLLNCYDSPILLFYRGAANLNASRIISVIGTRSHTEYSRQFTDKFIHDLAETKATIVSGLAFGVDALAHKAAIKNHLVTVGVLAHGLDLVYPYEHTQLAKDMVQEGGGLLTEFRSKTKPDKHHFPSRNRIVAGISDATVVVETGERGGSIITAELANGYNRDVFAVPGRISDSKSSGCNALIKNNKAVLLTCAADLVAALGWEEHSKPKPTIQKEMFLQLSANEKLVVTIIGEMGTVDVDLLKFKSGLSSSMIAAALLNLELQGAILSLPGKQYRLL